MQWYGYYGPLHPFQVKHFPALHELLGGNIMPPTVSPTVDVAAEFDLDLRIIADVAPGVAAPCNTDDGCDPSCASSCTSNA